MKPYPILNVEPWMVLEQEQLGTKRKFWYRDGVTPTAEGIDGDDWLFKYPQEGTGQHWAEKLAEQIGMALDIRVARVELAEFQGERGSASRTFRPKGGRWQVVHGNEVLSGRVLGYQTDQRHHQRQHTFSNIVAAIRASFKGPHTDSAMSAIAGYLMLDAVIGNTDRHHENWALLLLAQSGRNLATVAPSFDHASSLGRELRDEGDGPSRKRLLGERNVGRYSEKGHGGIYWLDTDKRGVSPLELVRRAAAQHPEWFRESLAKARSLSMTSVEAIVAGIPTTWMSEPARAFAVELVKYNLIELAKIN